MEFMVYFSKQFRFRATANNMWGTTRLCAWPSIIPDLPGILMISPIVHLFFISIYLLMILIYFIPIVIYSILSKMLIENSVKLAYGFVPTNYLSIFLKHICNISSSSKKDQQFLEY